MACGCPVVSTDCPSGPKEILEGGACGVLVLPKDPEGLARGILQVLENPGFREELSEKGKKRSLDFTVDGAVEEYIKLMEECMKE